MILRDSGARPQEVAAQLVHSEPAGDAEVVSALCRAAAAALGDGAPDAAVAYLERALREPPAPEERAEVLRRHGRAVLRTRGAEGLASLRAALDEAGGDVERAQIALELARALEGLSRNQEAVVVYQRAVADRAELDDAVVQDLEAGLATAAAQHLATLPVALEVIAGATATPDANPVMRAALALAMAAAGSPDGVELAQAVVDEGALLDAEPSIAIGLATAPLLWGDRFDRALAAWDEVIARARRNAPLRFAFGLTFRAQVHHRAGRLAEAEADARAALALPDELWVASAVPVDPVAVLAEALVDRGALAEAEALLAPLGPGEQLADYQGNNLVLLARGRLRLAQNRPGDAAADLLELGRRCDAWTLLNPAAMPWRSHAALALVRADRERALTLALEEVERARAFGAPRALGVALRAAGLVQGGSAGLERLHEAADVLDGSPAVLERALALVDLGAAERRARHRAAAREQLAAGLDLAARCGAGALADRARAELRAAGARPMRDRITGRDALTASEERVARMAAEGRTNREIAAALWVTLKTVETHLSHAYRKLGISSRDELRAALDDVRATGQEDA